MGGKKQTLFFASISPAKTAKTKSWLFKGIIGFFPTKNFSKIRATNPSKNPQVFSNIFVQAVILLAYEEKAAPKTPPSPRPSPPSLRMWRESGQRAYARESIFWAPSFRGGSPLPSGEGWRGHPRHLHRPGSLDPKEIVFPPFRSARRVLHLLERMEERRHRPLSKRT